MGLLDFLTSAQQALAGSSVSPSQAVEGETNPGLMSKLGYGGIPIGTRMGAAIEALQRINRPELPQTRLALMVRAREMSDAEKKAQKEKDELQAKANRLADKLEPSNPELAAALREDPTLVNEYGKSSISDTFETKRYNRTRADQLDDRAHQDSMTREGWDRQASLTKQGWEKDAQNREDNQQHDLDVDANRAKLEMEKQKAVWARDDALRQGRADMAKMISDGFLEQTGVQLPPPSAQTPTPGPSPIPAPMPGNVNDVTAPGGAPGLLTPNVPSIQAPPTDAPGEQGDAGEAPPQQVKIWSDYFSDPDLSSTEAAQLTSAFKAAISESIAAGKDPDKNLALGAAAEVYRGIQKTRNETKTAQAAEDEANQKIDAADVKARIDRSNTAAAAKKAAEQKTNSADSVLQAISNIETAIENKDGVLPSTGAGSYAASFLSDTNARAIFDALQTVNANTGFDRLQQMKEASPTGGALGQIAVQELEMLHATIAKLDPTDINFKSNLKLVKERYSKVKQMEEDLAQDIENLRKYPTAEHKKEFDDMYGTDYHLQFTGE